MSDVERRCESELTIGLCILDFLNTKAARENRKHILIRVSTDLIIDIIGKNAFEEKKLNGIKLHYKDIHVVPDDDLPEGTCLAVLKH